MPRWRLWARGCRSEPAGADGRGAGGVRPVARGVVPDEPGRASVEGRGGARGAVHGGGAVESRLVGRRACGSGDEVPGRVLREAAMKRGPGPCGFDGCGRPRESRVQVGRRFWRDLCAGHTEQRRRGVALSPLRRWGSKRPCPVCGRGTKSVGGGGSGREYRDCPLGHRGTFTFGGTVLGEPRERRIQGDECAFPNCDRPRGPTTRGRSRWCEGHRKQKSLGKPMTPLRVYRRKETT